MSLSMSMDGHTDSGTAVLSDLLQRATPLIAVSFSDTETDDDIAEAIAAGLDVAELRIDRYSSVSRDYVMAQVQRFAALPTIATIRTAAEGGDWEGTEDERLRLFMAVLPEVDGIDIELSSDQILPELVAAAKAQDKVVVVSNHNFEYTPTAKTLEAMATDAKSRGADYVKISARAKTLDDVRTLARFILDNTAQGLIVIAMGPHGPISRIFFPALGSRLTYAAAGQPPVSGQLTFSETFAMMREFYPDFNGEKIISLQLLEDA